jgi:signal transduction histidine kinase/YHS domain-containing protein
MIWFVLFALTLGILILSNAWCWLRVIRPLRQLALKATDLTRGNLEALEQPCGGISEIDSLRRSMAGMVGHVRRAQEQSRSYADVLTQAQEAERARLARELHDDTVQSLVAVAQGIDLSRNWLDTAPEKVPASLQATRQQVVDTVISLRDLIGDLRPPALAELGLVAALTLEAKKADGMVVTVAVEGTEHRLDEARELTLFRCAQQALNNARTHGHATRATVLVSYGCEDTSVTITDDGQGFVTPDSLDDLAERGHYGLLGIRERVQSLHGEAQIISSPDRGTSVTVRVPQVCADQPEHTVRDPVCSAYIEPQQAYGSVEYKGQRYYFCCPVCQGAFQKNPEMYLQSDSGKSA